VNGFLEGGASALPKEFQRIRRCALQLKVANRQSLPFTLYALRSTIRIYSWLTPILQGNGGE
jgi:hypothetical protein